MARLSLRLRLLASGTILLAPAALLAQQVSTDDPAEVAVADAAFVDQAPQEQAQRQIADPVQPDQASKVYFPDEITPEAVAASRMRAREQSARQDQVPQAATRSEGTGAAQLAQGQDRGGGVDQLSAGGANEALAQLTPAEREVLIDAVEGTDICDRQPQIAAIQTLCAERIETRSVEFAQNRGVTAADAILGQSLDSERVATLEAAIARLARAEASTDGTSDSVIASVAFTNFNVPTSPTPEKDPQDDLSPETQAVIGAIVQQLGGP